MTRRNQVLLAVAVVALFAAACGSGASASRRPAHIPQPAIDVRLTHPIFFGSQSSAPATIEVLVENRGPVPITVRRVEVDSPGMAQYTLRRAMRQFRETVPPGGTKALTVFATAVTSTSRPTEPLSMRAILEFEVDGKYWREIVLARG